MVFGSFWLASLFLQVSSLVTKIKDLRGNPGLPLPALLAKKFSCCVSYCLVEGVQISIFINQHSERGKSTTYSCLDSTHHCWIIQLLEVTNMFLGCVGFLEFLRCVWKVIITMSWSLPTSAPGNVLVLAVLIPEGTVSSPRCSQSGCDVFHLGCAMSAFWMAYGCLGCLPAQGCCRLQSLGAWALCHWSLDCGKVHRLLPQSSCASSPTFAFQSPCTTRMSSFGVWSTRDWSSL